MIKRIRNWIRNWEGVQGQKKMWSIYIRRKNHYCPCCYGLLEVKEKSKIVNSESEEAKNFDFSSGGEGGSMIGNVKFTWDILYCGKCNLEISELEIRNHERRLKGKKEIGHSKIGLIVVRILSIITIIAFFLIVMKLQRRA